MLYDLKINQMTLEYHDIRYYYYYYSSNCKNFQKCSLYQTDFKRTICFENWFFEIDLWCSSQLILYWSKMIYTTVIITKNVSGHCAASLAFKGKKFFADAIHKLANTFQAY